VQEPFQCFSHVVKTSEVHFEIQDTGVWLRRPSAVVERLGQGDPAERQVGGVSNERLFDIHEVLEDPTLFGIAEIELDPKARGAELMS
jgi:hypothetical protein